MPFRFLDCADGRVRPREMAAGWAARTQARGDAAPDMVRAGGERRVLTLVARDEQGFTVFAATLPFGQENDAQRP